MRTTMYTGKTDKTIRGRKSDTSVLEKGAVYTIIGERMDEYGETFYTLKGFPGKEFNSSLFSKKEAFAQATRKPIVGKPAEVYIIGKGDQLVTTSKVLSVEKLANCMYKVETLNSILILQVVAKIMAA